MMSGVATYLATLQDDDGAIIDPFIDREHQYTTPYFAAGVACLVDAEVADRKLSSAGVRAMEKATADFAKGHEHIPDGHGEFYIASLTQALEWFEGHVDDQQWQLWRERLTTPIDKVIEGRGEKINNWRTYAMKGEYLRAKAGLVSEEKAFDFIEDAWLNRTQRQRMTLNEHNLYLDWNGDPQSHAVEAVGRGNLMALIAEGYDGPSSLGMMEAVERGTRNSLYLQDPTGQCPPNGRTDNHVFNDLLYGLIFDTMAEREWRWGEKKLGGQYRRAAQLGYGSIRRWQRYDGKWKGSFYVTKNRFDPAERVGYQPASQYTNYNATILFHLAEAYHTWQSDIPAQPTPAESEGYILKMDDAFGSLVVAFGGTQLFINLRGDSVAKYGTFWTPLGIARISLPGMDSRLGPIDGHYDARERIGATLGPTWKERGRWVTLAEKAEHYRGYLATSHPVEESRVSCTVLYAPVTGVGGPIFELNVSIVGETILLQTTSPNAKEFGLLVPSIKNDGRAEFSTDVEPGGIITHTPDSKQRRVVTNNTPNATTIVVAEVKSATGILQTYRLGGTGPEITTTIIAFEPKTR